MPKKARPSHRKKLYDPLVRVNGANLRAALEYVGLSNREAARRLRALGKKNPRQTDGIRTITGSTVDYITTEPQQQEKVRQSVLDGFVTLLGGSITTEWLRGETPLPGSPYPGVFDLFGASGDVAGQTQVELVFTAMSGGAQLIANEYVIKCCDALLRDLRRAFGTKKEAEAQYARWASKLATALLTLVDPQAWQFAFLAPKALPESMSTDTERALVDMWLSALRPWFEGQRQLDVSPLLAVVRMLQDQGWPAACILRDLDQLELDAAALYREKTKRARPLGKRKR